MADSGILPPLLNPTAANTDAYFDVQRKQQLAQALMSAFQQSSQTPQDWNSMRVVPKRSALSNVTALASALMAGKAQQGALDAQKNYFLSQNPSSSQSTGQSAQNPQPAVLGPPSKPGMSAPIAAPRDPHDPALGLATIPPSSAGVAAQFPQQAAPPQTAQRNPRLLTGDPGTSQFLFQLMGPQEYGKALAGQYAPTDMEKMLRAARIDPDSAEGQQAMRFAVAKANYIPNETVRANSGSWNPVTKQFDAYVPSVPEGSVPQFSGGFPTSVNPLPGSEAAAAAAAAGKTAGTVSQTPLKVGTSPQGEDIYRFPTPPALANAQGASRGSAGPAQAPKVGQPATASPAVVQSQKSGAEAGQSYATELAKNATGATEVRRSLAELKNLASQARPGGLNDGKMKLGSYMIAAGVDPATSARWLGVDVGALQAAQKQTATLAVNTIHSMTNRGTNFDLETFMRNNPNLNMSDPSAFNKVVDYMDNKSKQEIAKQKDFVQWKKGVSPDQWESGHTAHWLEQQNSEIDQGRSNSTLPPVSHVRQNFSAAQIQAELRRRGLPGG